EVQGDVLAGVGAPEEQVATARLRRRDLAARVVLRARVVIQLDAATRECVKYQAGAVESDCARTGIDARALSCGIAAAPRVRHAPLRHGALDHVLGGLPAVDAGNRAIGVTGWGGQQAELLQEVAPHVLRYLRRGRRVTQDRVDDRDRIPADERAGNRGQRRIPQRRVPLACGRRLRAGGTVPVP